MKNIINNEISDNLSTKIIKVFNYINNANNNNSNITNTNDIDITLEKDNKISNIIGNYLKNPKILETDKKLLVQYINELTKYIKTNNNMLIPFLIQTNKLIQDYINSDLDEEIDENNNIKNSINSIKENKSKNYNNIFMLLKQNSFISKETIIPIYSYFSDIYNDINNNKEKYKNFNIKKFRKMIQLWKIFYTFEDKKFYSESSFCSLGSGLIISFNETLSLENNNIFIKIKFYENNKNIVNNNYYDIIGNEIKFLTIDKSFCFNFNYLKKFFTNKNIKIILISFKIFQKEINCKLLYTMNNSNKIEKKEINLKYNINTNISDITILENYIGQIRVINVKLISNKDNKSKYYSNYIYKPFPNFNSEFLREINNNKSNNNEKDNDFIILDEKEKEEEEDEENNIFKIKIIDQNLFKINYINYNQRRFNVVEYFGGFIQLLPFADLIKKLYLNEKLNNNLIKNETKILYISFIEDILLGFFHCILYHKINEKIIKKFYLFIFSILFEILSTILKDKIYEINNDTPKFNINQFIVENFEKIDIGKQQIIHIYIKFINFGVMNYDSLKKDIEDLVDDFLKKEIKNNNNNEFQYIIPFQQLYKTIMKQLFIFNQLWSNKKYFFNKEDKEKNIYKVKYKQYNHYTKSFQRPIIYPILEPKKYYPKFERFNIDNLYKNKNDKILDYNFDFFEENNPIINVINKYLINYKNNNLISLKCCLVKNLYHIKGNLYFKEIHKNKKNKFKIYFIANNNPENKECCNIPIGNERNNEECPLCFGSPFPYKNLNYNLTKVIKSKDIIFVLKREYFHRVSAIEIFTYKNKSYLFNFYEPFNIKIDNKSNNKFIESNIILSKISHYFHGNIILNREKENIILGYYNKRYKIYMFPFFHQYISLYSNYDKLIFINLLSNRSFNDIYQYPIFPMFYKNINLTRNMSQPIGFQDINRQSEHRKKAILYTYQINKEIVDEEPKYVFNIFYSNPIFLCNFLIRIFPYSLLGIEFQGDGFDDPNRLFTSIEGSLNINLSQKSDLREMIPELFYFPELYSNKNELKLGKINNNEIDNVTINLKKYKDFDKYEYICQLRDLLENEKDLDLWIDLIFGINQKESEEKYQYYPPKSMVNFNNEPELYNDNYSLESIDFGVIPFQLLNYKFPKIDFSYKQESENIIKYNVKSFKRDHLISNINKISFICKTQFIISKEYLNIINKDDVDEIDYKINSFEERKFYYIFKGDIFGNISIYMKYKDNEDKDKNNDNISITNKEFNINEINNDNNNIIINNTVNNNYIIVEKEIIKPKLIHEIKKIFDHNKEIKYIDCNPRLNLFLSYSLDGFINVYTFPKCKLVSVIKINDYIGEENPLIKVVLISNPFPMIFCYNDLEMFVFTVNGELIRKKEKDKFVRLYPCVDKSLGLIKDIIRVKKKITGKIVRTSEIELPSLDIHYLME